MNNEIMKTAVLTIKTTDEFKVKVIEAAKQQGQAMSGYVLAAIAEKMNKDIEISRMGGLDYERTN